MTRKRTTDIWGITCFFNPSKYKNKLENYNIFRESSKKQGLKLLTVECAFGDEPFELNKKDCDKLIQVRSNSIMWQKERLLNIGLKNLPKSCKKFAWLDADIIFLNENWVAETDELLDKFSVVQLFEYAIRLPKNNKRKRIYPLSKLKGDDKRHYGYIKWKTVGSPIDYHNYPGFGWAARRDLFDKIGFYDMLILGGTDYFLAESIYDSNIFMSKMDLYQKTNEIFKYANKWNSLVNMRASFTNGTILHLFHGSVTQRLYPFRYDILKENDFDELKDLKLNSDNCWEWSSNNKKLMRSVNNYFKMRNEENVFSRKRYIIRYLFKINYFTLSYYIGFIGILLRKISPKTYNFLLKIKKMKKETNL